MEYCLADGDGSATMWTAPPDTDVDGDGTLDAVGLDVDGDGCSTTRWPTSTATASPTTPCCDLDGDGCRGYFTDDGSGTWAVSVDRGGQLRWFGLDGVEHSGGPVRSTVDGDGAGRRPAARHRRRRAGRPRVERRVGLRRHRRRRPLGHQAEPTPTATARPTAPTSAVVEPAQSRPGPGRPGERLRDRQPLLGVARPRR